jgi:hypothetical protein
MTDDSFEVLETEISRSGTFKILSPEEVAAYKKDLARAGLSPVQSILLLNSHELMRKNLLRALDMIGDRFTELTEALDAKLKKTEQR